MNVWVTHSISRQPPDNLPYFASKHPPQPCPLPNYHNYHFPIPSLHADLIPYSTHITTWCHQIWEEYVISFTDSYHSSVASPSRNPGSWWVLTACYKSCLSYVLVLPYPLDVWQGGGDCITHVAIWGILSFLHKYGKSGHRTQSLQYAYTTFSSKYNIFKLETESPSPTRDLKCTK